MILHTARYSSRLPDRLDITRAGCDRLIAAGKPAPGEVLAPSHAILWPALRAIKADVPNAFADYREKYLAELRQRYRTRRAEFETILALESATLVCFCADVTQCHRSVAAEVLTKLGAEYRGEA